MGEKPEPGSLDALLVHLVDFVCEELWSLADDSGDEHAAEYDQTAERLMTAGGTPKNKHLYAWLRSQVPDSVRHSLRREAKRIRWPFIPSSLPESERPVTPSERPIREHSEWAQLQDLLIEGCKACQCGKPGRLKAKEKQEREIQAQELIKEVGELQYNDALLVASQRLQLMVTELIHEWDFEVEWQKEWVGRSTTASTDSAPASSSTDAKTTARAA